MDWPLVREGADYRTVVAHARAGVAVADAVEVMQSWAIPVAKFAGVLGVSERKWSRVRAAAPDGVLSPVESDRLIRVLQVLEHARSVFDDESDAVRWLALPNEALCGEAPLSWMDTDAGVHEVDDVLSRLEFGVYG